jgi:hypothetical protein
MLSIHRLVVVFLIARPVGAQSPATVRVVRDEAEAALAILQRQQRGEVVTPNDWRRLFESEGYRALARRESAMGRAFTDSSFAAFLRADTLRARTSALAAGLETHRTLDATAAGQRALAYLPKGARINTVMFPMIKPITNSFVFRLDSVMGIFMYVDPQATLDQISTTLTHELHHVGFSTVCAAPRDMPADERVQLVIQRAYGFGEGLAMLAAAGGANVNPHAVSDSATRTRWDADVANVDVDLGRLQTYFMDVLDGRIASLDSARAVAMTFYGVQGPWYTVGWVMGSTIEREFGHARLLEVMCDPRALMAAYDEAVVRRRPGAAVWSPELLRRLGRT